MIAYTAGAGISGYFRRFESFAPLTLETKPLYDKYIGRLPAAVTSPVFFQDLYSCNLVTINRYKILCGHLCFIVHDTMEHDIYALPPLGLLGGASFGRAVDAVYRAFSVESLPCVFQQVSEFFLPYFSSLDRYEAEISYDIVWSDYIFTKVEFVNYLNKKSSREMIRHFVRNRLPKVREISSSDADEIAGITKRYFCVGRKCENCYCGCEVEIARRLIDACDELEMNGVIVESDGEAIGYEAVCCQKDTMLFISKKVRRGTKGLNEYLNSIIIERFGAEVNYINYSEDMGNEGLRAHKSRMGNHFLSHRYGVKLNKRV